MRRFLYTNFDSPAAFLHADVVRRAPRMGRLLTRSLERHVAASFSDRRIRQVLGYPAVFLGSSPSRTPSIYHLMSRLDLGDRVLYPQGGFTRLVQVLADLATRHGVRVHTGAEATAIATRPRAGRRRASVTGVDYTVAGRPRSLPADVVVGAADLHHLETALLPRELQTHPERSWRRRSPGPGAVLAMLGVEGRLPQLAHHTLFFTADWAQNFGDIFGPAARIPDPASIYVCKPSASDATVAPDGCENLFVLVPVPADVTIGRGGDDGAGSPLVERTADAAIDQVAAWAGVPDLRARIRVRHTVGPEDFAREHHSWRGGALGLEHNLRQSAFFRPRNVSRKVDGLLYAGASTVPGVGLPMCLISAELVLSPPGPPPGDSAGAPMSLPHWSYVAMLAFCLAGTLPLVPAFRLRVLDQPRRLLLTIALAGTPFLVWDLFATHAGHWWFDADQTLPWRVAGLPLEEIGFFVVIPLVAVLTFEGVRTVRGRRETP
ncbi:phytoene desaturase family protein [Nocardioides sp. TF02-7]|nr:phytoene desaturase family protein [Nocardioides sp. TF02-7]